MRQLEDRVAIVTGGATGIGRASAVAFAAEGAAVVIGDVNVPDGERTVAEISEQDGRALFVETDVSSPHDCRALVGRATDAFGRLDIMHANAGIELCRAVWDTSDDEWRRVIDINLSGAFYCSREAMSVMREQDGNGVILVTASPHAFLTGKEIAAYAASKGGLVALMRALALEGAPKIRANAILPGAIATPMIEREVAHAPDPEAQLRTFAQAQPLGRLGEPEEIARVAVFLVSDAAAFVTGACVAADGGLMAALNSGPGISYAT